MPNSTSIWTCENCGKLCFRTRRDAKKAAATVDRKCRVYRCPADDDFYHFGHLPTAVRMGDFDRRRLRRMRGQA
jgi:hypothetical protein